MKKAFLTTIEIQMAVLAETETEAQRLAFDNMGDEIIHPDDVQVGPLVVYPDGWEGECVLYSNGDEELTLREALENKDA